ncbi:MAG: hypothetical protein ACRCTY_10430, partial [Candidatus Adiutrix sp.]
SHNFSALLESEKQIKGSQVLGGSGANLVGPSGLAGQILASRNISENATNLAQVQLENGFNIIEKYAQALGDNQKTLKEVEPLANEVEKLSLMFSQLSESLPVNHPLKSLSQDAAVLSTVESMKFKRGDYV